MTQAVNTYCVQDHLCRMKHHSNHVKRYVFISQNELSPGGGGAEYSVLSGGEHQPGQVSEL